MRPFSERPVRLMSRAPGALKTACRPGRAVLQGRFAWSWGSMPQGSPSGQVDGVTEEDRSGAAPLLWVFRWKFEVESLFFVLRSALWFAGRETKEETVMSRKCDFCGKSPQVGNNVSHANNKNKRVWLPNLQSVRHVDRNGSVRRVRACTRCIRTGLVVKPA